MDEQDSQQSPGSAGTSCSGPRPSCVSWLPPPRSIPTPPTSWKRSDASATPAEASAGKGLADAARFWEPRRLLYNLLLLGVVLVWVTRTWPHFRPAITLESLGILTVLALLANLCYCAGYLAEILIQNATSSVAWNRQRWAIWVFGMLLAILFENYWIADEIYPFVH